MITATDIHTLGRSPASAGRFFVGAPTPCADLGRALRAAFAPDRDGDIVGRELAGLLDQLR